MSERFKADMEMLVGKKITVTGFRTEPVQTADGMIDGTIIEGVAGGREFEVMTFSKVLTDYLHKMPVEWFPFNSTIVSRVSDAGYGYFAFSKSA